MKPTAERLQRMQAGAVELVPRGTARPALGWPLALPGAGAYASKGGGVVVDPFTDQPTDLATVSRRDAGHWGRFLADARARLPGRMATGRPSVAQAARKPAGWGIGVPPNRIDARTRDFLGGRASQGTRNAACFAAACNLLGVGVTESEAERLILAGAATCGLSEREARTCLASAIGALRQRGRQ